ncbi:MAG: hypothetical protein KJO23_08280 [Bacteroidia bacterium]|nr:hypothetical protein [Bacteroidia bacterium]
MKKSVLLLSIFSVFLLCSCGGIGEKKAETLDTSDFRTESALGTYEMAIPKYMKPATDLNSDASMQFQNIFKETYLAVIDEDKQDFVDAFEELGEYDSSLSTVGNYRKIQVDYFLESLDLISKEEPKALKINGMNAEQIDFTGRVAGVDFDIFYVMTFVEGKDNLYMVMTWTLGSSEGKYKETFYEMADSFREI